MLNMAISLVESARRDPAKTAVLLDESKLSYAELNAASSKVANALKSLGVRPGDKVALMLPNVPQFPIVYYGILKLGATVVPLNVLFKAGEIDYHLQDADAVALFAWEGLIDEAKKGFDLAETCRYLIVVNSPGSDVLPEGAISYNALLATASPACELSWTMPDDTAVILYTAGTTGRPKGAELTHFNMFYNAAFCADRLVGATHKDVIAAALPLFHSFGQTCAMNLSIYAGATLSMLPHFTPQAALEMFQRDRITIFAGVPTMYFYLLNFPEADRYDLSALRLCVSGGAALPVEVMKAFEKKYNVVILEGYGLSETSPVASFNMREQRRKPGSIGIPIWGTEMRVVDDEDVHMPVGALGEIVIRGHNVMKGYYKRPEATAEVMRNGWFHSGDIARMDEEGYFYIVDRKKEMIIRGGFNVYPREVEDVLYAHPAVSEVAVVGVPDEALGEEVKAFVVVKPGMTATADELMAYCQERVASFKCPRIVEFRDSLPKGAAGRILKRELRN